MQHWLQPLFALIVFQYTGIFLVYVCLSQTFAKSTDQVFAGAKGPHLHVCDAMENSGQSREWRRQKTTVSNETSIMKLCVAPHGIRKFSLTQSSDTVNQTFVNSERTQSRSIWLNIVGICQLNVQSSFSSHFFCASILELCELWHIKHELNYWLSWFQKKNPKPTKAM